MNNEKKQVALMEDEQAIEIDGMENEELVLSLSSAISNKEWQE